MFSKDKEIFLSRALSYEVVARESGMKIKWRDYLGSIDDITRVKRIHGKVEFEWGHHTKHSEQSRANNRAST